MSGVERWFSDEALCNPLWFDEGKGSWPKAYGQDLRNRVIDAVLQEGLSAREAASHFRVGIARWIKNQPSFKSARLIFVDETGASTNMTCQYGWCGCGARLRVGVPHGHWHTTTFVAGFTSDGFIAPMVLAMVP